MKSLAIIIVAAFLSLGLLSFFVTDHTLSYPPGLCLLANQKSACLVMHLDALHTLSQATLPSSPLWLALILSLGIFLIAVTWLAIKNLAVGPWRQHLRQHAPDNLFLFDRRLRHWLARLEQKDN